jgi:hypothetical protein
MARIVTSIMQTNKRAQLAGYSVKKKLPTFHIRIGSTCGRLISWQPSKVKQEVHYAAEGKVGSFQWYKEKIPLFLAFTGCMCYVLYDDSGNQQ